MSGEGFRAGFSRICINPVESVPLGGFGNERSRFSQNILTDITASCIALTDPDGSSALLISIDMCSTNEVVADYVCKTLSEADAIPSDRIYISATHTHSAPSTKPDAGDAAQRYTKYLSERILECARKALSDRSEARLFTGTSETQNMNYFKHYVARHLETGEISYIGDQFGTRVGKEIISHVGQVDPTMYVVEFRREGQKNIILTNWRAHPHFTGGFEKYDVSADYIGTFRDELESRTGAHVVYFQGACGNINAVTRIEAERRYTDIYSFGKALAGFALAALSSAHEIKTGKIRSQKVSFLGKVNHATDALVPQAQQVLDHWLETYDRVANKNLAQSFGIRTSFHARSILSRSKMGEYEPLMLNAVSIGDELAFVTYPGELFDALSVGMECQSPFETTMLFGYSMHHAGYLPTAVTYVYTSYETDSTRFAAGTGEEVMAQYVKMLNELKET